MRLEHSFTVPVPADQAWKVLLDVEQVAPCLPGAALTGFDGERFTGKVRVKLGPVNLTYQGSGRFVERDETELRVVMEASGRDGTSASTAAATITATLHPGGEDTRVEVVTDLRITGRPAQFGRGMIADVSGRLLDQFAGCLALLLTGGDEQTVASSPGGEQAAARARPGRVEPAAARARPGRVEPAEEFAPAGRPAPADRLGAPEPVDLFALTGLGPALRRARPYAIAAALALAARWGLARRRSHAG